MRKNGEIASQLWVKALANLSKEQIRLGVAKCEEKILSGDQWPPDLAEFMAIIHGHSDIDFQAAYLRCVEKKPVGRPEQWVYENCMYNLRRMGQDQAERAHKKYLLEAIQRDKNNELELKSELLARALPEKVDRNLNDIKRQEWDESGKVNPKQSRIERLKAMQKARKKNG